MEKFSAEFERLKMPPIVAVCETVRRQEEEYRKRTGEGIVHFERGDVDFDTPPYIVRALVEAVERGQTRYPRPGGMPSYKQAVLDKLEQYNGIRRIEADQVVCTNGSQEALGLSFQLFRRGRGAGFSPCWSCVPGTLAPFYGIDFREVPLNDDFSVDFKAMSSAYFHFPKPLP